MTDDIAAWLTAIWDEQEAAARAEVDLVSEYFPASKGYSWKYRWSRMIWHDGVGPSTSTVPGAPSPQEVLARIAADRQILAMHVETVECGNVGCKRRGLSGLHCIECDEPDPCKTLRLLASVHATRPGYSPNWRP